jgi:hypothetical protein
MMRNLVTSLSNMSKDLFGQARELEIASLPKEEVALIKQRIVEEQYQQDKK